MQKKHALGVTGLAGLARLPDLLHKSREIKEGAYNDTRSRIRPQPERNMAKLKFENDTFEKSK